MDWSILLVIVVCASGLAGVFAIELLTKREAYILTGLTLALWGLMRFKIGIPELLALIVVFFALHFVKTAFLFIFKEFIPDVQDSRRIRRLEKQQKKQLEESNKYLKEIEDDAVLDIWIEKEVQKRLAEERIKRL